MSDQAVEFRQFDKYKRTFPHNNGESEGSTRSQIAHDIPVV